VEPGDVPSGLGYRGGGHGDSLSGGQFQIGQQLARMMGGMGRTVDGGYAEYTCVPVRRRAAQERAQPGVVANQTLGGQNLLDAIRDRLSPGPAEFWVLVPATPTTHLVNDFNALSCAFPVNADLLPSAADVQTSEQGITEASSILDTKFAPSPRDRRHG